MTIFKYIYEQLINAIIDEVNDGLKREKAYITSSTKHKDN
jgi:hypothetical protein